MNLKINKSIGVFLLLFLLGGLISMLSFYILPERFFYDTDTIVYDRYNEIGLIGSYPFSIWFYSITGLKHLHFSLIGLIQYSIVIFILYKIGVPERFDKLSIKNMLVYLAFIMIAIFLSMPTKEFITFLYMALIVFILNKSKSYSTKNIILILGLLLFFGYFFRPYYILVAIVSFVFYAVSRINFKKKKIATIFYGISVTIIMSLSYGLVKGEFISQKTRETINEARSGGAATNTVITSPISTDTWYGESFGIVYGFFSVNFPVNSLKFIKSPQIIIFVIWQLLFFIILIMRYDKCLKKGVVYNREIWMFYIMFSFFIIQGVFEPDLGSAIRHKMGVFPIIYFVLYYDTFRKKIQ